MSKADSAPIVEQIDLTLERTKKEKLQRQLLEIDIALERGDLELCGPIEARLTQRVMSCKAEYIATAGKIKAMIFTAYGIDVDIGYLDQAIEATLTKLAFIGGNGFHHEPP